MHEMDWSKGERERTDGNGNTWRHFKCPFCRDRSKHFGVSNRGSFRCLRCSKSGRTGALVKLAGLRDVIGDTTEFSLQGLDHGGPTNLVRLPEGVAFVTEYVNTLTSKWTEFPDVERYLWFDWDHPEYLWFKYVVPSGDGGVIGRRTRGEGPKWLRFGDSGLVALRERASLLQRGRPVTFVEGVSDLGPFPSNAWAMGGSAGVEYAKEYIEKWEPSSVTLAMDADSAGKQFVKDLALFCIKRGIPVLRNDYVSGGDPASSPLCGVTRLDSLKRILEESRSA